MIPNGAVSQKLSLSHSKIRYATLSIANVRKKGFGNCPFIISQRQLTTAPQSKVLFVTTHFIFRQNVKMQPWVSEILQTLFVSIRRLKIRSEKKIARAGRILYLFFNNSCIDWLTNKLFNWKQKTILYLRKCHITLVHTTFEQIYLLIYEKLLMR